MNFILKIGKWLGKQAQELINKACVEKYGKQIGHVNRHGESAYRRRIKSSESVLFKTEQTAVGHDGSPRAIVRSTDFDMSSPLFAGTIETTFLNGAGAPVRVTTAQRCTNARYTTIYDIPRGKIKHIKINKDPYHRKETTIDRWTTNVNGTVIRLHQVQTKPLKV